MFFGALTWIGFMVVALGWALLLAAAPAIEIIANVTGRNAGSFANMGAIAECTIITGFGLAIVGALHTGFGALNGFFGAVLERTARQPAEVKKEEVKKVEARISLPAKEPLPAPAKLEPTVQKAKKIVERGRLKERAYVLFGDGSVEVETLLGLRRFASLGEAYEFIS
jgi:hypothetical protein